MAAVVAAPHRRAPRAGRCERVPRAHDDRHRLLQAQLLDLHRVRGPVRLRRDPLAGRRPHRVRERLPAPGLEVPAHHQRVPRTCCPTRSPRRARRKILWDNAVDFYRFPEGYLPTEFHEATDAPMARGGLRWSRSAGRTRRSTSPSSNADSRRRPSTSRRRGSTTPSTSSTSSSPACRARAHQAQRVPFFARRWDDAGFDPPRSALARRPRRRPRVHRRRHPELDRGAPAVRRLPGRHAGRRAARADAGLHVGRHDGRRRGPPSTPRGTARSARCSPPGPCTCRASGPATSCSTRGPTAPTTAPSSSTRRCTTGSTAS